MLILVDSGHIDQWNRIKNPKRDPHRDAQLIVDERNSVEEAEMQRNWMSDPSSLAGGGI